MKGLAARARIARLNVALALCTASVWTFACFRPATKPETDGFEAEIVVPRATADGPRWTEAEWVELVRRFHGTPPTPISPRRPVDVDPSHAAGPLPLPMYRIAVLLRSRSGPSTVCIVSKDSRRPSRLELLEGRRTEGVEIGWIRDAGESVEVELRRGAERFVLVHGERAARPERIVAVAPCVRDATSPSHSDSASSAPRGDSDPGLRLVPWLGPDGRPAGVRVTGMAPDSTFARAGIRVGDAILALDEQQPTQPSDVIRRWRDGWRPASVVVCSTTSDTAAPKRISLR